MFKLTNRLALLKLFATLIGLAPLLQTIPARAAAVTISHRSVQVAGHSIFYREAGPADAPVILLLHGFPSSSFMFRELIPALAHRYRVIAPDYPGFGQSSFPDRSEFAYTFANLAAAIDAFTREIAIQRYALYIQDYGAPIGLRLALAHPERVSALIVQNGNAYAEGLSGEWAALQDYWRDPSAANRARLRGWLTADGVRQQYTAGVSAEQLPLFSPDTWTLDWALLSRPGNIEMQLDLFGDYRSNVDLYPRFQQLFRERQFPTLIVWGERDVFFTRAGAQAYRRDLPNAEVQFFDAGHFALETHHEQIAASMLRFLDRVIEDAQSPAPASRE